MTTFIIFHVTLKRRGSSESGNIKKSFKIIPSKVGIIGIFFNFNGELQKIEQNAIKTKVVHSVRMETKTVSDEK